MAKCMDFTKAEQIIKEQEKLLQFDSFNNEDAWKLGCFMVEEVKKQGIDLSICIRKINGNIIFQYVTEGTSLNNQKWMQRKFNTVSYMEMSSLRAAVISNISGEVLSTHGLSETEYKLCGGGFPVRIKNSGLVMVITVSNLPHEQDHDFIISCLERYLQVEVPHMTEEIPIP